MRTIEEKAIEYAESKIKYEYDPGYFEDICKSFMKGSEFAQRWTQIARYGNGYITAHSLSDIERNLPVIMNDEDGDKDDEYIIIKHISDLLDMDESFTHWRPVNLK